MASSTDRLSRADARPQDNGRNERYRETLRVTLIGSVVDLTLGVAKIIFGFAAHSQALIADGIHSLSDLATDGLVLYAAKHASREADEEHPYGHGRFETIATVGLGIVLAAVATGIAFDAVTRLFNPDLLLRPGVWALVVAGLSIVSKEAIYHYTMRAARKYRSDILRANAWHSRTDAVSSVIVVVGVAGTMAGLPYLDAIAAVGVALMIARIAWDLGWRSVRELVDTALDRERVETIRRAILEADGVRTLHMLRTRRMGGDALVDVHIQVEPTLSVSEGHHVGETMRNRLIEEIPEVSDVTVHVDTENDQEAAATTALPLRHVVLERLERYFKDIDEARSVAKVTLHYLKGKIHVELLLPLEVTADGEQARRLQRRFQAAVGDDPDIARIELHFH